MIPSPFLIDLGGGNLVYVDEEFWRAYVATMTEPDTTNQDRGDTK